MVFFVFSIRFMEAGKAATNVNSTLTETF
jgi:hypothetical protein